MIRFEVEAQRIDTQKGKRDMNINEKCVNDMNGLVYATNGTHNATVYRPYVDPKHFILGDKWAFTLYTPKGTLPTGKYIAEGEGFKSMSAAMKAAEKLSKSIA